MDNCSFGVCGEKSCFEKQGKEVVTPFSAAEKQVSFLILGNAFQ
jgi:hypothetical protein